LVFFRAGAFNAATASAADALVAESSVANPRAAMPPSSYTDHASHGCSGSSAARHDGASAPDRTSARTPSGELSETPAAHVTAAATELQQALARRQARSIALVVSATKFTRAA
jgi:hypothetical protein